MQPALPRGSQLIGKTAITSAWQPAHQQNSQHLSVAVFHSVAASISSILSSTLVTIFLISPMWDYDSHHNLIARLGGISDS
jgi:hypothetical protein